MSSTIRDLTLRELQSHQGLWATKNFPEDVPKPARSVAGVTEECGEFADSALKNIASVLEDILGFANLSVIIGRLNHSQLKLDQGIRGSREEHNKNIQDAIGDVSVYFMDYCNKKKREEILLAEKENRVPDTEQWELDNIIRSISTKVFLRDWIVDSTSGVSAGVSTFAQSATATRGDNP